ncbi:hypothetical protein CDAR_171051 [Caerostris darwini]|uniref:Uncharacterized protein n=1 Tax=Caerostris darwini TaxID=1538125 RepID=A0AAV4PB02_9ARAC|nr:hypothetical protein CDAR_171051 [Caerostris darwini]
MALECAVYRFAIVRGGGGTFGGQSSRGSVSVGKFFDYVILINKLFLEMTEYRTEKRRFMPVSSTEKHGVYRGSFHSSGDQAKGLVMKGLQRLPNHATKKIGFFWWKNSTQFCKTRGCQKCPAEVPRPYPDGQDAGKEAPKFVGPGGAFGEDEGARRRVHRSGDQLEIQIRGVGFSDKPLSRNESQISPQVRYSGLRQRKTEKNGEQVKTTLQTTKRSREVVKDVKLSCKVVNDVTKAAEEVKGSREVVKDVKLSCKVVNEVTKAAEVQQRP